MGISSTNVEVLYFVDPDKDCQNGLSINRINYRAEPMMPSHFLDLKITGQCIRKCMQYSQISCMLCDRFPVSFVLEIYLLFEFSHSCCFLIFVKCNMLCLLIKIAILFLIFTSLDLDIISGICLMTDLYKLLGSSVSLEM